MLTVMLVYTKGWRRAFCIGALFPAGVALFCAMSFVNPAVGWLSRYSVNPSESAEFVLRFQVLIAGCLGLMFVLGHVGGRPLAPAHPVPGRAGRAALTFFRIRLAYVPQVLRQAGLQVEQSCHRGRPASRVSLFFSL